MTHKRETKGGHAGAVVRTVAIGAGFTLVVVVLLLWLAGVFSPKIDQHAAESLPVAGRPVGEGVSLTAVESVRVPTIESAVGTIRAVHETAVASKLLAKVIEVNVQAGQTVAAGDVLVRLDDEDLKAQLRQAEATLAAARAARDQAQIEYDRVKSLFDDAYASKTEFDQADTALKTAIAEVERAEQARAQMQATVDYATIRSPLSGKVIDKEIEVGDTARPGQVLVTLFDPTRMQLIASVRESLTQRLKIGQSIGVKIDALGKACRGQISEIVPEAESSSRTFQVKVTGPCPEGVYSGMFGRLLIPLDDEDVLLIPRTAVRRVGQLDIVDVAEDSKEGKFLRRRVVQLGRDFGDDVQVLSGLRAGELVAVAKSGSAEAPGT